MNATIIDISTENRRKWLKRVGMAGFWFFLVKGLLWLAAPFVFYFAL